MGAPGISAHTLQLDTIDSNRSFAVRLDRVLSIKIDPTDQDKQKEQGLLPSTLGGQDRATNRHMGTP